jgi:3-oxoacid CoA-transferase subunit B
VCVFLYLIASKYKSAYIAAKHGAFHLLECAPGVTIDEIKAKTSGNLVISDKFKTMSFE